MPQALQEVTVKSKKPVARWSDGLSIMFWTLRLKSNKNLRFNSKPQILFKTSDLITITGQECSRYQRKDKYMWANHIWPVYAGRIVLTTPFGLNLSYKKPSDLIHRNLRFNSGIRPFRGVGGNFDLNFAVSPIIVQLKKCSGACPGHPMSYVTSPKQPRKRNLRFNSFLNPKFRYDKKVDDKFHQHFIKLDK